MIAETGLARRPHRAPRRRALHRGRGPRPGRRRRRPRGRGQRPARRRARAPAGCSPSARPRPRWSRSAAPLRGRDRLLALMDVGALLCRPRTPRCAECPLRRRCATRGPDPRRGPVAPGRVRGVVPPAPRPGDGAPARRRARVPCGELDAEALASLVADGLAVVQRRARRAPVKPSPVHAGTRREEVRGAGRGPTR